MKLFLGLALTSMLGLAESWSGILVDADCYQTEHKDTRPGTHPGSIDNNRIIRMCAPKDSTSSFGIVQQDGTEFNLDSAGNQKAREMVSKQGTSGPYRVSVTGEKDEKTIKVSNITAAK